MATLALNDRQTNEVVAIDGQTDFPVDFPAFQVNGAYTGLYARRIRDGEESTLSLADFDVVDPVDGGFTARLNVAAAAGDLLLFYGKADISREQAFQPGGAVRSDPLETSFTALAAYAQEARRDIDRGVAAPFGETGFMVPAASDRRGKLALFEDSAGAPLLALSSDDAAQLFKGDPGGNSLSASLFTGLGALSVAAGTDAVCTTGRAVNGVGRSFYIATNTPGATAFRAQTANGRWFEADTEGGINVKVGGAVGDDATDDAAGVQAAHDHAPGRHVISFPPAGYRIKASAVSPFYFGNLTASLLYPGVMLTTSQLTFFGPGARVRPTSRTGSISADVFPAFTTQKNMAVGTITDLNFFFLTFDTNNDGDVSNSNQRGGYFVGVDGLRFIGTHVCSTGGRRGYFTHIQNCRNVMIVDHLHKKVTGGNNFRYCDGVLLANAIYDDFSEAIDLDGTAQNVVMANLIFRSTTNTAQALDINDVQGGVFANIIANGIGNLYTINYKTTTPDTFYNYVNLNPVTSFQVTKRIGVYNVSATGLATGSNPAIYIGWDWAAGAHVGAGPVQDIIAAGHQLDNLTYVVVREATRLSLVDWNLTNVKVPATVAAIYCISAASNDDQIAWSDLDVTFRNVKIDGSDRGGISISTPSFAGLTGVRTRNMNQAVGSADADVKLTSLHTRGALVTIDGLDCEGTVILNGDSTAIPLWGTGVTYPKNKVIKTSTGAFFVCTTGGVSGAVEPAGSGSGIADGTCVWRRKSLPYEVLWGRQNKLRGSLLLQGDVYKYAHGFTMPCQVGDVAAAGTVSRILFTAKRRCAIARMSVESPVAWGADAVNYRAFTAKIARTTTGGGAGGTNTLCSCDTKVAQTAFVPLDFSQPTAAYIVMEVGDTLYVDITAAGTGRALTGVALFAEILEM